MTNKKKIINRAIFIICIVCAISILLLPQIARFPFIADDYSLIRSSLKNPFPIFSSWTDGLKLFRPMVILTFNINYQISSNNPWSYYLLNAIVHLAASITLFFLLYRIFLLLKINKGRWFALLLSSLFFFSPQALINTYWISGRTDLLCTLFILLSLLTFIQYIRERSITFWLLTIVLAIIELLCKETAVILVLYAIVITRTVFNFTFRECARIIFRTYVVPIFAYLILRFLIFHDQMFGAVVTDDFNLSRFVNGIMYGLWSLFMPVDVLDIYTLLEKNIFFAFTVIGILCLSGIILFYTLQTASVQIRRFSYYAIGFSVLSICIYVFTFPSSRLMYTHLPLLIFSGGGILSGIAQNRKWMRLSAIIVFTLATFIASSINIHRFLLAADLEKNLQRALHQCKPITQEDNIILLGGISRIGQVIVEFRNGLNEKISFQETGRLDNIICKTYKIASLDGINPSVELSYRINSDTILVQTNDAGSSLVKSIIDKYETVTFNEDSSIVCIPDKFLRFRKSAPRECTVAFNSTKIPASSKIIFLHKGRYYMRSLKQFKNELACGQWQ